MLNDVLIMFKQNFLLQIYLHSYGWIKIWGEFKLDYFLPHHGVYKPENLSTALCVVFNPSAKTINKKS